MSKQERVVCAAMQVTFATDRGSEHMEQFTSAYYYDLSMKKKISVFKNRLSDRFLVVQLLENKTVKGFITNKLDEAGCPRFVNQAEALRIALDSRQLEKDVIDRMIHECAITLKPEDLY